MNAYFNKNLEIIKQFDCCEAIKKTKKMPNGLIDFGTSD